MPSSPRLAGLPGGARAAARRSAGGCDVTARRGDCRAAGRTEAAGVCDTRASGAAVSLP